MGVGDVGPFQLVAALGAGGSGRVYQAVHTATGVEVAVKTLSGPNALQQRFLDAFRAEIRAVARLAHPHIVWVYEHGVVRRSEAEASGELVAGSPWFAMELTEETLRERAPESWEEARGVLLALLDALAHAHARGVIHRDLKPANVLLGGTRPGIKLSDFGLAHRLEATAGASMEGTPAYMAPEQLEGRWRDFGPWTDLYALGCLAWTLLCGDPPYGRPTSAHALAAHRQSPPPFAPRLSVPGDVVDWLHRLLEKDPRRRYRFAVDARCDLEAVGGTFLDPVDGPVGGADGSLATATTLQLPGEDADPFLPAEHGLATPRTVSRRSSRLPDWRGQAPPSPPPALVGTGLGLWGLRELPLVDRDAERETLWAALQEVVTHQRPRAVLLRGPAGLGKSRLARWLGERAHELGVARTMLAVHGRISTPSDGLPGLVAAALGCAGLSERKQRKRVEILLRRTGVNDPAEWDGLVELLRGSSGAGGPRAPGGRQGLVERFLARQTAESPVVLWLDDVQWGSDTLSVVRRVLQRQRDDLPVLVVLTARDEALEERPREADLLERMIERDEVGVLDVGPLPEAEQLTLVQTLPGLDEDLARRVAARTGGNPLFAEQLLSDWVTSGVLRPGRDGRLLLERGVGAMPASLGQLWEGRLQRLLSGAPEEAVHGLELAAALGVRVDAGEWEAACAVAGFQAARGLVDRLAEVGLTAIDAEANAFSFAHGMLREALERRAAVGGRLDAHHRVCAEVLRGDGSPAAEDRRAPHLLASGQLDEAFSALMLAFRHRLVLQDYPGAKSLMDDAEWVLRELGALDADPRWGEVWQSRAGIAHVEGDPAEQVELCSRALSAGAKHRWSHLESHSRRLLAMGLFLLGRLEDARREMEAAVQAAKSPEEVRSRALAQRWVGLLHLARGEVEAALEWVRSARSTVQGAGAQHFGTAAVEMLRAQAYAYIEADRHAEAERSLEEAERRFEALDYEPGIAGVLVARTELQLARGDFDGAHRTIEEALDRYRGDTWLAADARGWHALTELCCGRPEVARQIFEEVLPEVDGRDVPTALKVRAGLLGCTAELGDGEAFDALAPALLSELGRTGLRQLGVRLPARRAAEAWRARGDLERATQARRVAELR